MVPDRGAGRDQQPAPLGIVSLRDDDGCQTVFLLANTARSVGQAAPLPTGSGPSGPFDVVALAYTKPIQPQPGDDTDMVAHRSQPFE
jgi:hypothetical protein